MCAPHESRFGWQEIKSGNESSLPDRLRLIFFANSSVFGDDNQVSLQAKNH